MPSRPCLTCGALVTTGSYCPAHEPVRENRQTLGRHSAEQFRHAVVEQAGRRCQWVGFDALLGTRVRCTQTSKLQAHHVVSIRDGGSATDPANGVALCRRHHELAERAARLASTGTPAPAI